MDAQHVIARRMVIGIPPEGLTPSFEKDFAQFPPAGVILFARDFKDLEDARRLIARLRALAAPRRLFVSLDEEGGWVSQLAGHLVVPPNAATSLTARRSVGSIEGKISVRTRFFSSSCDCVRSVGSLRRTNTRATLSLPWSSSPTMNTSPWPPVSSRSQLY